MNGSPRSSSEVSPSGPSRPRNSLIIILLAFLSLTVGLIFSLNHKSPVSPDPPGDSVAIPETLPIEPAPEVSGLPGAVENSPPPAFPNQNRLPSSDSAATAITQQPQPSLVPALAAALTTGGTSTRNTLTQPGGSTSDLAELGRILKEKAPGLVPEPSVNDSARQSLDQIARGELKDVDAGPLFQLLKVSNDPTVVEDLTSRISQWPYYAIMALSQLPDGRGIPSLVQQLQNPDPAAVGERDFALQMLAQNAARFPDAASALLDQARSNQLSERAWRRIVTGLAGDQYQFGSEGPDGNSNPAGLKTYHMEKGNQNFYSLPVGPGAQTAERLALLDQLVNSTSNPVALGLLQNARANLSGVR
jgi:HEAT repeat protein